MSKSKIGRLNSLTVRWAGTLDWFTKKHFAGTRDTQMDDAAVRRAIEQIRRDHTQAMQQRRGARTDASPSANTGNVI